MNNKLFKLGMISVLICFMLTGCTVNFNINRDHDYNSDDESNTLAGKIASGYYDNYEDDNYWGCDGINCSYIDLGNNYYYIIYKDDEENPENNWIYETEITNADDYSNYLEQYNDEVLYIVDNGKLVALNPNNGEELWKIDSENIIDLDYGLRDDGTLDLVYGKETKSYICVNKNGDLLKKIDLSEYQEEYTGAEWITRFDYDSISIMDSSELDYLNRIEIKINLDDFSISSNKKEYEEITKERLAGKTIISEWNESFVFDEDGTVIVFDCCMGDKYSVIRYNGTWDVENGKIFIKTTEAIVAYDGEYDTDVDGDRIIVNYNEKAVPADKQSEYEAYYCPEYDGKEVIILDGMVYEYEEPVG